MSGIPQIVGVIDGTHLPIRRPVRNQSLYYNRKKYHSVNNQVVCDSYRRIIDASVCFPGSWHDGRMFRRSALKRMIAQ